MGIYASVTMLPLGMISWYHIVIVLVIVLLLFGGKKLPELARGLGRGMRIFRDEMHGLKKDIEEPNATKPAPQDETKPIDSVTEEKK